MGGGGIMRGGGIMSEVKLIILVLFFYISPGFESLFLRGRGYLLCILEAFYHEKSQV